MFASRSGEGSSNDTGGRACVSLRSERSTQRQHRRATGNSRRWAGIGSCLRDEKRGVPVDCTWDCS